MLDKFAGFKSQIRILEKQLKDMDHSKLDSAKVKEVTEAIKNLKDLVKEKEDKRDARRKAKEESSKPAEVEATVQPTEVVKESSPTPTEEVVKEADVNKFAIDSKVEPIRGTPGSWGTVIREAGINGDPLCYVKWHEGTLKEAHGEYGAYYPSDLKLKSEVVVEAKDPTQYVPREQLYNLEADLRGNYEKMIADLHEEIQMAKDKGELTWVGRLEEKLSEVQKSYDEKYNKTADSAFKCDNCGSSMSPLEEQHLENLPNGDQKWICNKKKAEDENGSGGTEKLKVVDLNPPYDKDPQEKSTGYGGDRMGWQTAPNGQDNSLPLKGSVDSEIAFEKAVDRLDKKLMNHDLSQTEYDKQYEDLKKQHKVSSLKSADLDLESIDKRWALYVDGKLAIRTLTRSKAERIAKEKFPEQVAAGKYEIKREDHTPVVASLDKQAIHVTVSEKLFIVNPLAKTAENEYAYDVNLADGSKLFKITSADEMGEDHLAYVIEKELTKEASKKEAKNKCVICNEEFNTWPEYDTHKKEKHGPKMAKLTSNLAFLKKGSLVSVLDVDTNNKQIKFASLDNSLRGWAPMQKFAAMDVPSSNLIDHSGHKDEVLSESGNELLVTCPANSNNVIWREITAPPATPESLNDLESAKECSDCHGNFVGKEDEKCPTCGKYAVAKQASGCDQCEMLSINGIPTHETGCPANRKVRDCDHCGFPLTNDPEDHNHEIESSLNKDSHIRHEDGKWVVYNHDYTKTLGSYPTKEKALERLRAVEYFKSHKGSLQPLSKKEADQDISLEQQVQSFRDRMSAVTERLSNPPAKTADLETTEDLSNVEVKDLSDGILHMIDMIESKVGMDISADPEIHPMLEDLENKVWEVEMKLGIRPEIPEHEALEPEHKEIVKELGEEVDKESNLEVKADDVNTPPSTLPPAGFRYAWDPKSMTWILVQITGAPGGGQ